MPKEKLDLLEFAGKKEPCAGALKEWRQKCEYTFLRQSQLVEGTYTWGGMAQSGIPSLPA